MKEISQNSQENFSGACFCSSVRKSFAENVLSIWICKILPVSLLQRRFLVTKKEADPLTRFSTLPFVKFLLKVNRKPLA